jgi:hypothetical protein
LEIPEGQRIMTTGISHQGLYALRSPRLLKSIPGQKIFERLPFGNLSQKNWETIGAK